MARLSDAQIQEALGRLSGWQQQDNAIERTFEFSGFAEAMNFVNQVAALAEQANHHPDISINYNRVKLVLTSHDSGGVTERDIALAGRINEKSEPKAA